MKNVEKKDELIDNQTLMLESVFTDNLKTRIVKTDGIYYSESSILKLLEDACIRNASTVEGRLKAIRILMNYSAKVPLLIEPNNLGAFPTMSYKHVECVWIFNHPFEVEELSKGKSIVHFPHGIRVSVNVSKQVLLKQHHRLHTSLNIYGMNHLKK